MSFSTVNFGYLSHLTLAEINFFRLNSINIKNLKNFNIKNKLLAFTLTN